jgi:hypothetical protein
VNTHKTKLILSPAAPGPCCVVVGGGPLLAVRPAVVEAEADPIPNGGKTLRGVAVERCVTVYIYTSIRFSCPKEMLFLVFTPKFYF